MKFLLKLKSRLVFTILTLISMLYLALIVLSSVFDKEAARDIREAMFETKK